MNSPSTTTFWRLLLIFTSLLSIFSIIDTFRLAERLEVDPFSSKTILGMLAFFVLAVLSTAAGFALTFTRYRFGAISALQLPARIGALARWGTILPFAVALLAFPVLYALPGFKQLFDSGNIRFLVFWLLALSGMYFLQALRPAWGFPSALAATLVLQSAINLAASYLPAITDYPFALGWSETSRFYFPSLFFAEKIYGQSLPWPILHPSLHLLLTPPYWFDAPLWFHRAWQVGMRFLLVGLIAPALLSRFKVEHRVFKFFLLTWILVYLFVLPLYLHLPLMIFPLLWLFRPENDRRSWILLILTSLWAGISRLNWYPMPGMILSILWLLETNPATMGLLARFWRPAAWTISGTLLAYAVSQLYIPLSGNQPGDFFTSLSSALLWPRLWPNETYALGIVPGILLFSLPLLLLLVPQEWRKNLPRLDLLALAVIMLVLFAGGLLVSLKIGGGADLHNMDAYAVVLLIVAAYAFFRRQQPIRWQAAALLVLIPAWFAQQPGSGIMRYDQDASQATLTALQQRVERTEGEILFINQRHLIAMDMLEGVTLIPEYEREDLMEMAMANNTAYLERFEQDIASQRFAAIIVDPLRFNLVGEEDAMGAENNAWSRRVAKPILCWYREDETFPADRIVIYVPREEGRQCP